MRVWMRRHLLGSIAFLCTAASMAWSVDEDQQTSSSVTQGRFAHSKSSFAAQFGFRDPNFGIPMPNRDYRLLSRDAYYKLQGIYASTNRFLRLAGIRQLLSQGSISSPSLLRRHPSFVNSFDGTTFTPTVYVRIADVMPNNPMGRFNPDVAIFMQAVKVLQPTVFLTWLELKHIIRGPYDSASDPNGPDFYKVWVRHRRFSDKVWLDEFPEVYKWPVFADVERLGFNPSTIDREIAVYSQERAIETYPATRSHALATFLAAARRYMLQFDTPTGEALFNSYALMLAPVDASTGPEPWFQAPVFEAFHPGHNTIKLKTYDFDGGASPILDRIQYTASTDAFGHSVLTPIAIVRPLQVVPTVRFGTVYVVPQRLRATSSIVLQTLRAVKFRLVPDPEYSQGTGHLGPDANFLGERRPIGHPLALITASSLERSRSLAVKGSNSSQAIPSDSLTKDELAGQRSLVPDSRGLPSIASTSRRGESPLSFPITPQIKHAEQRSIFDSRNDMLIRPEETAGAFPPTPAGRRRWYLQLLQHAESGLTSSSFAPAQNDDKKTGEFETHGHSVSTSDQRSHYGLKSGQTHSSKASRRPTTRRSQSQ
ncbi:hypothetical protein PHSY_006368 [Pseudozyma hubeiensis SY62]|uniref:Uncharacterized protein n=1 Tax=Pseudozyma hubeiensis (strain SY62) TaxID=1305764 RepID=R9PBJ4_PSEHS|nr:hypothetical protein PHSY_006368 [Pseudozyma hubeiensis SY62]GAC98773.1 hypothetical protein PHSY_006368 [Pseudozyma hubeiensis SY62]